MTYQTILYDVADGVATITLNRPDVLNAMNDVMRGELTRCFSALVTDDEVRVVVVTGHGDRAFSAGADIREFVAPQPPTRFREQRRRLDFRQAMDRCSQPIVAAIRGFALGGGLELALACDIRIAVPRASIVEAFVRIGLTVDGGVSWLLPRLIGTGRALELFYTGDPLPAEEALALGALNRVVEPDQLEPATRELAERLAAGPAQALGAIKRSVNYALEATFEEAVDFEFHLQGAQMRGEDFREGVAAFLEKRPPRFR